jgi:hypothetical protein
MGHLADKTSRWSNVEDLVGEDADAFNFNAGVT